MSLFLFRIPVTTALMCYDCNSEYDPRCGDPFDPYSIGEVNCSKQEPREHLKDKVPVLCRKTVQKGKLLFIITELCNSFRFLTNRTDVLTNNDH